MEMKKTIKELFEECCAKLGNDKAVEMFDFLKLGYRAGYRDGYSDACEEIQIDYEAGYDDGHEAGYNLGSDDGYDEGYSMAISKMATASPAIKSPQPNKEKNFRAACTHDRSNRFAPSSVIIVKKSATFVQTADLQRSLAP